MDVKKIDVNYTTKKSQLATLIEAESRRNIAENKKESKHNPFENFVKAVTVQSKIRYSFMDQTKVFPGYLQNLKYMDYTGGETLQTMYFNTGGETLYISDRQSNCTEVLPVDVLSAKSAMNLIKKMRESNYEDYINGVKQSNYDREKSPTGDVADEFLYQYGVSEEDRVEENDGYVPFLNAVYYRKIFKKYCDFIPDPTDRALQTYVFVPSTDIKGAIVPRNYSDRELHRLRYYNVFNKTAPDYEDTQKNSHLGVPFQRLNYIELLGQKDPLLRIVKIRTYPAYVWRTSEFFMRIKNEYKFLAKRKGFTDERDTFYRKLLDYLQCELSVLPAQGTDEYKAKDPEKDFLFLTEETDIDIEYIKQQQETNKTLYLEEYDITVSFNLAVEIDHPFSYLNSVYYQFQSQLNIPYSAGLQIDLIDNQNCLSDLWVNFGHDSQTVYLVKPIKDSHRSDGLEYIVKLTGEENPVRTFIPLGGNIDTFLEQIKEYGIYRTKQDAINHARHSVGKEQVELKKVELDYKAKSETIEAEQYRRMQDREYETFKQQNEESTRRLIAGIEENKAERETLLKKQEFEHRERENASKKTIETYKVVGAILAVAATAIGAAVTVAKVMAKVATVAVAAVGAVKGLFAGVSLGLLGLLAF